MRIQRLGQSYTNPSMKNRVDIAENVNGLFNETGRHLLKKIVDGIAEGKRGKERKVNIRLVRHINGNMPDILVCSVTPESKHNGPLRDTWIRTMKPEDIESFNISTDHDFMSSILTQLIKNAANDFRESHPLELSA